MKCVECEYKDDCYSYEVASALGDAGEEEACSAGLAVLLLSRKCDCLDARVAELEAERDRLVKEHMDFPALKERDEARAEVERWKEIARILGHEMHMISVWDKGETMSEISAEDAIMQAALSAPQAQEEEKP